MAYFRGAQNSSFIRTHSNTTYICNQLTAPSVNHPQPLRPVFLPLSAPSIIIHGKEITQRQLPLLALIHTIHTTQCNIIN